MSVLYVRNENSADPEEEDDKWDDTELQDAYERAKQIAMKRVNGHDEQAASIPKKATNHSTPTVKPVWNVGMPCRAVYTDGVEYEATIKQVLSNGNYVIEYIGYNNTQEVEPKDILKSHGTKAVKKQVLLCQKEVEMEQFPHFNAQFKPVQPQNPSAGNVLPGINFGECDFPPPPPLPPRVFGPNGEETCESEALKAMLMSWYMSGYYTGYYQGIKEAKKK